MASRLLAPLPHRTLTAFARQIRLCFYDTFTH